MNKIKFFFLKYWLFIFLTIITVILLGLYIKDRFYQPKFQEELLSIPTPKIESYLISISPNISPIEKKLSSFNEKQEVYQIKQSSFSDKEAILIGEKFGFLDQPIVSFDKQGGNVYNWGDQEEYLSINLLWGSINYRANPFKKSSPDSFPDFSQIEEIARNFLNKNGFLPPELISLKTNDIHYANDSGFGLEKVSSPQNANLIKIFFDF